MRSYDEITADFRKLVDELYQGKNSQYNMLPGQPPSHDATMMLAEEIYKCITKPSDPIDGNLFLQCLKFARHKLAADRGEFHVDSYFDETVYGHNRSKRRRAELIIRGVIKEEGNVRETG